MIKKRSDREAKQVLPQYNFLNKNRRGQVTIFIIIAILVVAVGVLIYFFFPKLRATFSPQESNPQSFIENCLEERIDSVVEMISLRGGSITPELAYSYYGNNVEYLCYSQNPYELCIVQQPLLIQSIESEIKEEIETNVRTCFNSMKNSYVNQGYTVDLKEGDTTVELLPKRIVTSFGYEFTLTKENSEKYDSFSIVLNNNLYELASIANSIIQFETEYGQADTSIYMTYYHDLKVEKEKMLDGTTIYILTDKNNGKKFQFASRSLVFPPGYF